MEERINSLLIPEISRKRLLAVYHNDPTFTYLDISIDNLNAAVCVLLAEIILHNTHLKRLDLCAAGVANIAVIITSLNKRETPCSLDLRCNGIHGQTHPNIMYAKQYLVYCN